MKSYKVNIEHFAGKKSPRFHVTLKIWFIVYLIKLKAKLKRKNPVIRVELFFDNLSYYMNVRDKENDWLKAIGTKSGVKTSKNHESIVSFRNIGFQFQSCKYINKPDTEGKKNITIQNLKEGASMTQIINLSERFAVGSHAGGTFPPDTGFSYKMIITPIY